MSNEHEEQVAGVTLWFKRSSLTSAQGLEKFGVQLELVCTVNDEELWKEVEKRFREGLRVFTGEDFHIEVMSVMRARIQELEAQCTLTERKANQERDAKELAQKELAQYKEPLGAFGRALRGG